MNQRRHLKDDEEHERLVEVGNWFWEELSWLCARAVAKMPREIEDLTAAYMQDRCSLYGSRFDQYLPECRAKEGT